MTKLTVSNASISNIIDSYNLTVANTSVTNGIVIGSNTSLSANIVTVGNSSINTTSISTQSLVLRGIPYAPTNPGSQFGGIINYQEFGANGTWNNPYANSTQNTYMTGNETVFIMLWGGGGGGANGGGNIGGGGGGCSIAQVPISYFTNTCEVIVGLGSAPGVTANAANGGNSSFAVNSSVTFTAYGGQGAYKTPSLAGGGGGGAFSVVGSAAGAGGGPLGGAAGGSGGDSTYGGGGGATNLSPYSGGRSIFGGGGGGAGVSHLGSSIYGGGGGSNTAATASVFGGKSVSGNTASIPGGGGFSSTSGAAQAGARGEVRVWVMK